MHLYAVLLIPLGPELLCDEGFIEFYWADDADHAIEQANDQRIDEAWAVLHAAVPNEYVRQPHTGQRRRIKVACAHELDYAYGPGLFGSLLCRLFGHKWEECEEHQVRWCDRCQTEEPIEEDGVDHQADDHDWETCPTCLKQAVEDGILEDARGVGGEA